jgi:hypothetical protein
MKSCFRMGVFTGLLLATTGIPARPQTLVSQVTPVSQDASGNSLKVAADTSFFAKLSTSIVVTQLKPNDTLEAQTTQDIKQGHDVLLKKGSVLLGHVLSVQAPTGEKLQYVVIAFNSVKPKNGAEMQFNLIVQALAPESDRDDSSLAESTGTSLQGATRTAGVTGHSSTSQSTINPLTLKSTGVIDIQGLQIGDKIADGKHYTVLAVSLKDVTLKKGTQLVMKVVAQ